jgi:hypothetical protein
MRRNLLITYPISKFPNFPFIQHLCIFILSYSTYILSQRILGPRFHYPDPLDSTDLISSTFDGNRKYLMAFQTAIRAILLQVRKIEFFNPNPNRFFCQTQLRFVLDHIAIVLPYFLTTVGMAYAECGVGEERGIALQVIADESCTTDKVRCVVLSLSASCRVMSCHDITSDPVPYSTTAYHTFSPLSHYLSSLLSSPPPLTSPLLSFLSLL